MRISNDVWSRISRLSLTILMTAAWSGLANTARAQPNPADATDDAAAKAQVRQAVQFLERMTAVAKAELRQPNAAPADVAARAAALGYDVDRTFAFVRDAIAYEPYRGVLRGPRGALAARAANAVDKSLLLVDLLKAGGHPARLVRGVLPADAARGLVERYLATDPLGGLLGELVPTDAPTTDSVPADFATRVGLDKAYLDTLIGDQQGQMLDLIHHAERAAAGELKYLQDGIAAAGITLGRTHDKWIAELVARAIDHVWVEVGDGKGGWRALDPSFAGTQPPRGQNGAPVEQLPADLQHAVQFQVVYRHGTPGNDVDTVIADVPMPAADALWQPPALVIVPAEEIAAPADLLAMDPQAAMKQLMSIKRFQAIVSLGTKNFASPAFDLNGTVSEVGADGRVKGAAQVGQATGGMFGGGLMGGGDDAAAAPASTFVDLSVRMTFTAPGDEPRLQSRVLLTRADTVGTHVQSPLLSWQMLLQSHLLDPAVAASDALQQAVATIDSALPMLRDHEASDGDLNKLFGSRGSTFPTFLAGFAQVRQAGLARSIAGNRQVAPLWDRPQLVVAERRFCGRTDGAHACARFGMDIVTNGLSFVPRSADATTAAPLAALRQGVFDTAAEAVLPETSIASGAARSALADTRRARVAGGTLVAYDPRQPAPATLATTLRDADRAWIAAHEPTGHRVLAFAAPADPDALGGDLGWWSLDPETGTILGRRDGGRGSAMAEYAVQLVIVSICLVFVLIVQDWEIKKQGGGKQTGKSRTGTLIQGLGCLLGLGTGALGVNLAGRATLTIGQKFAVAQGLGVLNTAISGGLGLWGYKAAE